jgi:ferrous iron transport protein B
MERSSARAVRTRSLRVALAGNPNAGKSTLFNALTGSRQHVGNWPGKTVEKKTGLYVAGDLTLEITDLPGAYSLSAFSLEETITRDFLLQEHPDAVIAVVDATNLERHLYLVAQLLELEIPLVIILNMMDVADKRGLHIDQAALSAALGAPVVATAARREEGLEGIAGAVAGAIDRPAPAARPPLDPAIASEVDFLAEAMGAASTHLRVPARWVALRLLEDDPAVASLLQPLPQAGTYLTAAALSRARIEALLGDEPDTLIAESRYAWIHELTGRIVSVEADGPSASDRIDRFATHRVLGLPIFLMAMWVVFKLTIDLSAPWVAWLDQVLSGPVSHWATAILAALGLAGTWVESLVVDGVIAGVGGVLAFLPVLLALYFSLAVLEDSGYMARGAFVMDRMMNRIGLHGRSFLPLMVGFGCSVPAIYATRTLTNQRDRILTGLLVPFMSCGARLPVYVLFATIFFPLRAGLVILGLYLLGIVVALVVGLLLQKTLLPARTAQGLVMELPPYRLPHPRSIWYHMWNRTRSFLQNATSLILAMSLVIWFLMALPAGGEGSFGDTPVETSAFGRVSTAISPVFEPLGFGSWQASGALISGLVAKEVVVSTLAQSYSASTAEAVETLPTFLDDLRLIATSLVQAAGDTVRSIPLLVGIDLRGQEEDAVSSDLTFAIRSGFEESSGGHGPLAALAFMVFVLLYTPCMAAVAAERHELGTRWMWLSLIGQLALAWLLALVVFQGGLLLMTG